MNERPVLQSAVAVIWLGVFIGLVAATFTRPPGKTYALVRLEARNDGIHRFVLDTGLSENDCAAVVDYAGMNHQCVAE